MDSFLPGANKNPSMQDVARLAGVSRTTVSFVINNVAAGNIPPETQQRVWNAVAQLGYRPNAIARNLRSQRTHTLGFISDEIASSPYAGMMILGAQDVAWEQDKLILLVNTGGNQVLKQQAAETLLERQVEGILYATMYHREVHPPEAIRDVPVILLDCFVADGSFPSVIPNEEVGGEEAVEFLVTRGHRRIGFLNNSDRIPAARGRYQGYLDTLCRHNLPHDSALIASATSDSGSAYTATLELLNRPNRPTALFCFNDRMAMGAYQAASDLDLAIPHELAIIGFDNIEMIAPWLRPALTTMQLPHYEMGRLAAQELLRQIETPPASRGTPVHHRVHCPLVERGSV